MSPATLLTLKRASDWPLCDRREPVSAGEHSTDDIVPGLGSLGAVDAQHERSRDRPPWEQQIAPLPPLPYQ